MSESHTKGALEDQFCSQRKDVCDCPNGSGNKYKDACKPSEDWGKYPQRYTKSVKDGGELVEKIFKAVRRAHEAHHIACVASVTKIVTKNRDIVDIVRNTKWCVNNSDNVIALPMWAHTIEWYCRLSTITPLHPEIIEEKVSGIYSITTEAAPPFENLPQHDYDHAAYIDEVDAALEDLVDDVKGVTGHKEQAEALASELNDLVSDMKGELEDRGKRVGGTHAAWNLGMNFRDSDWYLPFSMAKTSQVEARTFPLKDLSGGTKLAAKIFEVAEAFWLEHNPVSVFYS
jgi:hypothetical protein